MKYEISDGFSGCEVVVARSSVCVPDANPIMRIFLEKEKDGLLPCYQTEMLWIPVPMTVILPIIRNWGVL